MYSLIINQKCLIGMEWQFPGNVLAFASKTLCELRQVLHLKWYNFPISNITLFTDYSVWEFLYDNLVLVCIAFWYLMKNYILKSQILVIPVKGTTPGMKKLPEVHFIFNIHSSVFLSRYCSSAFIFLFYLLRYCYLKFVENMKYVGKHINLFAQFLFQETTEKAFWQVDSLGFIVHRRNKP